MAQSLSATLSSLRDVEGIIGSFVVNKDGDLLAQDLPAYFAGVAEEVGPRVLRLCDALSLSEGAVSTCTVRYTNHKLTLRSVDGALLAVLTSAAVNAPALRMAINLVARKCTPHALSAPPVSDSAPPLSVAPPSPLPPSVPAPSSQRTPSTAPVPTISPIPVTEAPAPPETRRSYPAAPESDGSLAPKKERALFFRGRRIG
jgi:predicted regulator of Ras-like GTPase activity (Roadblock/LC7/MglB family)